MQNILFFISVIIFIELESLLVVQLDSYWIINFFFLGPTVALNQGLLIIKASRSHSFRRTTVGRTPLDE